MTEQEKKQRFAVAIVGLFESFRGKASEGLLQIWFAALKDIPADELDAAIVKAVQTKTFMPTVAELRELCSSAGSSFDAMAEFAWRDLGDTIRRFGPDHSVNFADGIINAVIRTHGGWQRVCDLDGEEFSKWYRKDFLAAYVRFCRDGCSEELRAYHVGAFERANGRWIGQKLPGGQVYRLGMYGTAVEEIAAREYQPALPSPPAQQRIANTVEQFKLDLKTLED